MVRTIATFVSLLRRGKRHQAEVNALVSSQIPGLHQLRNILQNQGLSNLFLQNIKMITYHQQIRAFPMINGSSPHAIQLDQPHASSSALCDVFRVGHRFFTGCDFTKFDLWRGDEACEVEGRVGIWWTLPRFSRFRVDVSEKGCGF